jgi:general secretion pathway protein I
MHPTLKISPDKTARNDRLVLEHKRLNGFTLIEVMVALTIIAISLTALLSTSGTQASSAAYLKQKTLAHWVAVNELTQIRIAKEFPDVGDKQGSTTMANNEWYWTRTTKATEDEDARQITFTLYADKERTKNLSSLIGYANRDAPTLTTQ